MIPFDTEIRFEELPLIIGAGTFSIFNGTAGLEQDGDSFVVTGIELDGWLTSNPREDRQAQISAKHDDPFIVALFERLAAALVNDSHTQDCWNEALSEHLQERAA